MVSGLAARDGLGFATATALIPLKAHAWLDHTRRRADSEPIDSKDVDKHRSDVFRLAAPPPARGTRPGAA